MATIKELSTKQKKDFFKALVTKNFSEAGALVGLDKTYTNPSSLRATAYKLYKSIKPDELGIDKEVVGMVVESIEARKMTGGQREITERNVGIFDTEALSPDDTKGLVLGGRNKMAMLINRKLDRLSKNKKALDQISLTQLATTFGIFFDKAQILSGQATENIAVLAQIKDNITAEESLEMLLTMREREANNL